MVLGRDSLEAEMARHYGNMRFAMYTVFTAITGALLAFPFSEHGAWFFAIPLHRNFLAIAGTCLSVVFILSEWRISNLVNYYQKLVFDADSKYTPPAHDCWAKLVPYMMILPYFFAFLFWLALLIGCVDIQKPISI